MLLVTRFAEPETRRVVLTVALSVVLHGVVLASLNTAAHVPAHLSESKTIEVRLVNETPTSVAPSPPRSRVAVKPRRVAVTPAPAAAKTPTESPADTAAAPSEPPAPASSAQPALVEARSDVASLNNPKPPYPLAARRQRLQGLALLSVHVSREGLPSEVRLKQSSGHPMLDAVARETVQRWRFVPARRGDASVDSWVDVPIRFRLEQREG